MDQQFVLFAKFGDTHSEGKTISLSQADKWFKQAKIFGGTKITSTDTGITFGKFKQRQINKADFQKYVEDLATQKKLEPQTLVDMLTACGAPGVSNTTAALHVGGVDRLTAVAGYTGTHKNRFDQDTGKGKGVEGRENVHDNSGYVGGYKEKDTYDKKH